MERLDFNSFMHVGAVVKNIETTLEKIQKIARFDTYNVVDFPPREMDREDVQLYYHGEKNWYTARFCFIPMGSTEIELIEPVEGESVWKDFLREKGEGIHHLKYEVESINEAMDYFRSKGIACTQYGSAVGKNLGKTWAYFDTADDLGYVIEVLNRLPGEVVRI